MTCQFLGVCVRKGFLQYTTRQFHALKVIPFKPLESRWRMNGGMVLMTRGSQRRSFRVLGHFSTSKSYLEKWHALTSLRSATVSHVYKRVDSRPNYCLANRLHLAESRRAHVTGLSPPAFAGS